MTLYVTEDEVGRLVDIDVALQAVEAGFQALASGRATSRPRDRTRMPGGTLHMMQAGWQARGYLGYKAYTTFRGGGRFLFLLHDARDGGLLAIIEARLLSQLRTGAASGVATRHMARADAARIGIIGAGHQAEAQLLAVARVRQPAAIHAYSRRPEGRQAFVRRMGGHGLEVRAVESARQAVEGMDVVITITDSRQPVFEGQWLAPGAHVNAAGSNALIRRELDDAALQRFDRIVVDHLETAHREAGDLVPGIERAYFAWEAVRELGDVVAGHYPGRISDQELTLFKSHGLAIEDLALGAEIYERARAGGLGRELPV